MSKTAIWQTNTAGNNGSFDSENDFGPLNQPVRADNSIQTLQHRTELSLKYQNILTSDGKLTPQAVKESDFIYLGPDGIRNPKIIESLTKDGSNIKDWQKFTTQSVAGPNGSCIQVHFYKIEKQEKLINLHLILKLKIQFQQFQNNQLRNLQFRHRVRHDYKM